MRQTKERNTYKYHLILEGRVVLKSITYDLARREAAHQLEYPGSHVKQIGEKVTHEAAMKWECNVNQELLGEPSHYYRIEVASIPTENYKEVIEISVPTRFYWDKDGKFDGIEFGEFKTKLQPWEEDMVHMCLEVIGEGLA